MLKFSAVKAAAILIAVLIGTLFALPNALPESWRSALPLNDPVVLGLDLQGGSHVLLEVDQATLKDQYAKQLIGDIRQAGLHIGVELVRDPESKEPLLAEGRAVRARGIELGVIFGLGGVRPNVIKIKPALVINRAECDEVLDKLQQALRRVLRR